MKMASPIQKIGLFSIKSKGKRIMKNLTTNCLRVAVLSAMLAVPSLALAAGGNHHHAIEQQLHHVSRNDLRVLA